MWVVKFTVASLDLASCEAIIVSGYKTISAPRRAKPRLSREAKAKVLCANSEATAASLTSSALLDSTKLAAREAKTRAPLCANSIANSASLSLIAPSAKNLCREAIDEAPSAKDLCHEARDKAPLGANNEAILASLEGKALHCNAKFASKGRTKTVASSCEATISGEAILASPIAKKKPSRLSLRLLSPRRLTFSLLESL